MRVLAYYSEAIIPEFMEDITQLTEFMDGLTPFRCEIVERDITKIERITGIKESNVSMIIKVGREVPIRFKENDRVYVYDTEYRIKRINEQIPDKFKLKASKSRALYERYVEYAIWLGY